MRRPSRPEEAEALILDLIARDELLPDRQLPSEETLAELAGLSRTTIRNALLKLERQGLVVRRHGVGTFATGGPLSIATSLEVLSSIAGVIRSNGYEPQAEHMVMHTEWDTPSSIAKRMSLPKGSPVYYVARLYLADVFPAIYVINRIPVYLDGKLVNMDGFQGEVLPFLESTVGIKVDRALTAVRATSATRELATAMSVKVGASLLLLDQVAYSRGRVIAHSLAYHNSKYITYSVTRFPVAFETVASQGDSHASR